MVSVERPQCPLVTLSCLRYFQLTISDRYDKNEYFQDCMTWVVEVIHKERLKKIKQIVCVTMLVASVLTPAVQLLAYVFSTRFGSDT